MADAIAALRDAEEIELVTRGRRSGRPHAVRLWSAYDDGVLWLRSDAGSDWYRNLRADPHCRIRIAGDELKGIYLPSADEAADLHRLVALWREKYGKEWVSDWYVERGRIPVRVRVTMEQ